MDEKCKLCYQIDCECSGPVKRLESECEVTAAKLDFLKEKGITVGWLTDQDGGRWSYDVRPDSELCDRATMRKLNNAERRVKHLETACGLLEKNSADAAELWEILREVQKQAGNCTESRHVLTPGLRDRIDTAVSGTKPQAWDAPCLSCIGDAGYESNGPAGWIPFPCTCHPARKEIQRLQAEIESMKIMHRIERDPAILDRLVDGLQSTDLVQ